MAFDRYLETSLLWMFVSCARSGSISRAAAALGYSQPALSQQLRRLERSVGQPLLHRTATGVSLTRAGEALLPYAERILALSAQALTAAGQTVTGRPDESRGLAVHKVTASGAQQPGAVPAGRL